MTEKSDRFERVKCVTPEFMVSFPHLDKPQEQKGGNEPKFSVGMVFKKNQDLSKPGSSLTTTSLKSAYVAAATEKWGADPKKWPNFKHKSFRDGDAERPDDPNYANSIFCSAKARAEKQPVMIGPTRKPIDPKEIYAGCFAKAEIMACAYDNNGAKGVTFVLLSIQKTKDGERISGRKDPESIYDAVEDTSEDASNYDADLGI